VPRIDDKAMEADGRAIESQAWLYLSLPYKSRLIGECFLCLPLFIQTTAHSRP
jgi:hypothetical protein